MFHVTTGRTSFGFGSVFGTKVARFVWQTPSVVRRGCRSGLLASTAIGGLLLGAASQPAVAQQILLTGDIDATSPAPAPDAAYWDAGTITFIGDAADGSMAVLDGAEVRSTFFSIGFSAGATGTVTVGGSSAGGTPSILSAVGVAVGVNGNGVLTLTNGGSLDLSGGLTLAERAGSSGTLNIGAGGEAGDLNAQSILFGAGSSVVNLDHTGVFELSGPVRRSTGGTLTINQSAGYTRMNLAPDSDLGNGATNIRGGTYAITNSRSIGSGLITMEKGTLFAEANATVTGGFEWASGSNSTIAAASGATLTIAAEDPFFRGPSEIHFGLAGQSGVVEFAHDGGIGTLAGNHDFFIDAGTFRAGNAATASSLFFQFATLSTIRSLTIASGATYDINGFNSRVHRLTGGGRVVNLGAADARLHVTTDTDVTYDGQLSDGSSGGILSTFFRGAGTYTLAGVSDFTGGMEVSDTTVVVSGSLATPAIALGANSTLRVDGGTFTGAPVITFNSDSTLDITANGGPVSVGALAQASATDMQVIIDNELRIVGTGDGTTHSFTGGMSGTGSLFVSNGTDTQQLYGASSHEGETRIANGTLVIGHSNGLGAIAGGGVDPGTFVEAGGTLALLNGVRVGSDHLRIGGGSLADGTLATLTGRAGTSQYAAPITLTGGDAAFGKTGGGALYVDGDVALADNTLYLTQAGTTDIGGDISGTGGLRKVGTASVYLRGTNTYTGGTIVDAGTLYLVGGSALSDDGAVIVNSGAALTFIDAETFGSLAGDGRVSAIADVTVGSDGTDTTFSGSFSSAGTLFKTGNGTWTVTGDFGGLTGDMTVLRGALVVNTDNFGQLIGALNIGSLGTLGGAGTIALDVNVEGRLAPGNSPDTMTIIGDLTLNGSSSSVFELNTSGQVGGSDPLTGNDLVIVEGNLTLGGTLDLSNPGDTRIFAGYYTLFQVDGTTTGSFANLVTPVTQTTPISLSDIYVTNGGAAGNSVNLLVGTGQVQHWDGGDLVADGAVSGGAGTWNGTSTNWTTADGSFNDQWRGLYAVFDGAGGGTVTVADTPTFSRMTFSENGYEITGGDLAALGDPIDAIQPNTFATVTVDAGISTTISSDIADASGGSYLFIKAGEGELTLSGTTTFGDGIFVGEGDLIANGTHNGDVSVNAVGALSGTGVVNGLVFNNGTLKGSAGQVLTMDALGMSAGSITEVSLGAPTDLALFDVTNDLTLDGTLNVTDAGGFTPGVYRIFDYGGVLTDNGLDLGTMPAGSIVSDWDVQTSVAGQVNLVYASTGLAFWDGSDPGERNNGVVDGGPGFWQQDNLNWTNADGTINAPYGAGARFAVFQGEGGVVRINNASGSVSASGLQFASTGYNLIGGSLTLTPGAVIRVGDGSPDDAAKVATSSVEIIGQDITKEGAGTLVLNESNLFADLNLNEGIVSIVDSTDLGNATGTVTFGGGTLNARGSTTLAATKNMVATADARFDVDAGQILTVAGAVTGAGDVVKTGAGSLVLTNAANAYGDTLVEAGTLTGSSATLRGNIENAGLVIFEQNDFGTFSGTINGFGATAGTMEKRGGSMLALSGASTLDWRVTSGTLVTQDAPFSGDVEVTATGNFAFFQTGARVYGGALSGTGSVLANSGTLDLTGDNSAYGGLMAVEGGSLTLTGDFGGDLLARNAGRLVVNGAVAGDVTGVTAGSSLTGSGSIAGSVTMSDGSLEGAAGRVLSMGSLAMTTASSMNVSLGAPSTVALFDVTNDLTLDGTLNVTDAGGFGAGVYRLVDYGGTLTDNGMDIGTIPAGASAGAMSVQTSVAGQVNFVNASGLTLGFWDGGLAANRDNGVVDGGSGTWNVTNSNWTDINGTINAPYNPNPTFAVFQGTGGTVTIDNNPGSVEVTGLQFASDGYTVNGDPLTLNNGADPVTVRVGDGSADDATKVATLDTVLMGSSLRKTGGGTLVLSQSNSFIGMDLVAGAVSVDAQSQMGTTSGGVTFSGGTLRVTDSFQTDFSKVFTAAADARIDVVSNRVLAVNGIISGAGDLIKTGDGVLTLGNLANAYGDTIVEAGTLIGNVDSISGNIENAGHVIFDQTYTGTFYSTIGARGGVAGTMEKRGGSLLSLVGDSALDWQVTEGALGTSTSMTFSGDVEIGAAGELRFNQSGNRAYGGALSGTGDVFAFGGTLTLSGNNAAFAGTAIAHSGNLTLDSAFGGDASVRNGRRLTVNDSLAGDVTEVISSAILTGSGSIAGSVTMSDGSLEGAAGRVLSMGSLAMTTASSMNVSLGAPSTVALFDVTNDLTLNGTLNVTDAGGFGAGVYRLVDYGGTLTDNGMVIGAVPGGTTAGDLAVQTSVAGQVNLVNTSGVTLSFWDGGDVADRDNDAVDGGTGMWNATNSNWTTANGTFNAAYTPNPTFAVFQGTGGTVTISNADGVVEATGLQFASDGYTVAGQALTFSNGGDPAIVRVGDGSTGAAGTTATISADINGETLRKLGEGTLVLTGTNGFDGLVLAEGTVAVGSEANMGSLGSTVAFEGGTLRTTETFTTNTSKFYDTNSGGARFEVDGARALTVEGIVYGLGDLVKTGGGALILTNTGNSYNDTIVEAGTLSGNAGSIVGNIANAGLVIFDQARDATYAFNIDGFNGTAGGIEKRGAGDLTLTGASTLDWLVANGGLVSDNAAFSGDVAIAGGARFSFAQTGERTYGGQVAGSGTLIVDGGSLGLTGDSAGFAGATEVRAATLRIDDALGGSAMFDDGSRLTGTGTLGSGMGTLVTLGTGATLAPGNSIGTLTIDGNFEMAAGSIYEVEVAPGGTDSDQVVVTGSAMLAGGVTHIGLMGDYVSEATYTILTAGGGISGTFDSVTSDFAFLDPTLAYSLNDVTLTLVRNDIGFADVGRTPNQRATAAGLETLGNGNEPYDSVVTLDVAGALDAFDQLSGEGHATVMTGMVEDSDEIRDAVSDRIRATFGGAGNGATEGAGGTFSSKSIPLVDSPVWARATGTWRQMASDGNAAGYSSLSGGVLLGADAMFEDTVRLGFLAGFGQGRTNVAARTFSATTKGYHVGVYAGAEMGGFTVSGGTAFSWHSVDAMRDVAFAGFTDRLTADYGAGVVQAFGELSYGIDAGAAYFEPFLNVAHVRVMRQGFTETGGAAALTAAAASYNTTYVTAGMRAETRFDMGQAAGTLFGSVGWRQAYGDKTPDQDMSFAGAGPFSIAGAPIIGGAAMLEAGISVDLSPQASFGLSYNGQISSAAQSHGISASFNLNF